MFRNLRENEKSESTRVRVDSVQGSSSVGEQDKGNSTVTTANDDLVDESVAELDESSSNLLVFLAGLVIKAIGFQFKLLITLFKLPIWLSYCCSMLVFDPCRTIRRGREYLMRKLLRLWGVVCECVSPFIYEWLKEQKSMWKLALRFGWGLLWAVYVCCILCGLLASSFVVGGLMMRYIVEEPVQMKAALNFDYTKNSPVAFVPIISCPDVVRGVNSEERFLVEKSMGSQVIPPNQKLQVTVSLTLPESDYNRNLGMFQVRVDFLSANGKALASSSHPWMLQFKSEPIRLLLTFLEIAPLVTGYLSESQTLKVKMRGFTEGDVPTSCLRVMIEQRAEFRPGAGIPEIYDASLVLESELPLLKRILWYWKKTLFIWVSMTLFMMELLLALVCCRSIIIPRVRTRDSSAGNNTPQNNQPVQGS
ncbi:hypothetical protein L1049_010640 [Liquidambar formosana]|uniref:Seipin n=1 Tax=Liquidambar formosana TaxID=63359 RepID=A0AAP0R281_LIQFO